MKRGSIFIVSLLMLVGVIILLLLVGKLGINGYASYDGKFDNLAMKKGITGNSVFSDLENWFEKLFGVNQFSPVNTSNSYFDDYADNITLNSGINQSSIVNVAWDGLSGYKPTNEVVGVETNPTSDMAVLYHLNEPGIVIDSSGNNLNGGIVNNPIYSIDGKYGGSYNFTKGGSTQHIGFNSISTPADKYTISVWVKSAKQLVQTQIQHGILWRNAPIEDNIRLYLNNGRNLELELGSTSLILTTVAWSPNESVPWHHVVAVVEKGSHKLYVDNVLVGTSTNSSNINSDPTFWIGTWSAHSNDGYQWDGLIDEFAIYNRVLTSQDVDNLYNGRAVLGSYTSANIQTSNFNSIKANWSESRAGTNVEISSDSINWCKLVKNQYITSFNQCPSISNSTQFIYKVNFTENTTLEDIRFEWQYLICEDNDFDNYSNVGGGSCCGLLGNGVCNLAVDCNNSAAGINPGAIEIAYDGIDQNCNGLDLNDVDSDGFVCKDIPLNSCPGLIGDDCNDNNLNVFPNASEKCNQIDDDCDSLIDETFNLSSDVNNCGACGVSCSAKNVNSSSCVASNCVINSCGVGYFNVDLNSANGCEYFCRGFVGTPTGNPITDGCQILNIIVDNNMTGSIDAGGDCLSSYNLLARDCGTGVDKAYNTIQEAANVVFPGDSILIRAGTYAPISGIFLSNKNGTANQRIIVRNYQSERVIIDGTNIVPSQGVYYLLVVQNSEYITIEGLEITKNNGIGILITHSDYTNIRNNKVYDNEGAGIFIVASWYNFVEFNEAYNNSGGIDVIWDGGQNTRNSSYNIVQNNLAYDNQKNPEGSDGIASSSGTFFGNFNNNVLFRNGDDGFDASTGGGGIGPSCNLYQTITDNIVFGNNDGPATGWVACVPQKPICAFNVTSGLCQYGCGDGNGIKVSTNCGGGHLVAGNIVFGNERGGFDQDKGTGFPRNFFYNNIAYGFGSGYGFIMDAPDPRSPPPEDAVLYNNIGANNSAFDIYNRFGSSVNESDYNLWEDGVFVSSMDQHSLSGNAGFNDSTLVIATSFQTSWNITQKLDYIRNQVKQKFSLQAGSRAIDAGVVVLGFHCPRADDNLTNPYPAGDTTCRHWYGTAPDIGAYEYNPGTTGCITRTVLNTEIQKFVNTQIGIVDVTNKVVGYLGC